MNRSKVLFLFCTVLCISISGCWLMDLKDFATPQGPPKDKEIAKVYYLTQLRKSTAADVLPLIYMPDYALLSQSTKVLASQGELKKGYKLWFTMVRFDENDLLAIRKYMMIADEKPKALFASPWAGLRYDSELVMEGDILEKPYTDENTKRIAMLKFAKQAVYDDLADVKADNKAFEISGAMINQAFNEVLTKLDESPALAAKLSEEKGLEFNHKSFDRGRIGMTSDDKTMTIKIRLGSFTEKFEKEDDFDYSEDAE
ncbi:MAG: hypothetical protein WC374_13585 [Phycisphaerae bacterium]